MVIQVAHSYSPLDILYSFGEDQTIAATGYMQELSADKIVELGQGRTDGTWVIDVTSLEIASNNELYTHRLLGSTVAAFTAGTLEVLATREMGATEVRTLATKDSVIGRYEIPFCNSIGGVEYAFVKHHITVAGTIAQGVIFSSWLSLPRGLG